MAGQLLEEGEDAGVDTRVVAAGLAAWSLIAVQLALLAGSCGFPAGGVAVPGWLAAIAVVIIAIAAVFAVAAALRLGPGLTASPLPSAAALLSLFGLASGGRLR